MNNFCFHNGSRWVRADFHLHTAADKEFVSKAQAGSYYDAYVKALLSANIGLGVITNHNKFDLTEFKNLRSKAQAVGIKLMPGVELSINGGSSGLHVLIVFDDCWCFNKENIDYINRFIVSVFCDVANYENENTNSRDDIYEVVQKLNLYGKGYFLLFAHVESRKGLWEELSCGQIKKIFESKYVSDRVLGFQKVKTQDTRKKIRCELKNLYPAEVEGSDPKEISAIGKGAHCYLKLGCLSFEAVKFALQMKEDRVAKSLPNPTHSYIKRVAFEGAGSLGGTEFHLSSELNTLIGIRGSGKSSVLEGIRYGLDIPFGEKASDIDYKNGLVKHLLQSGGRIIIDAVDRHGQSFQIRRIYNDSPDVYVNDKLQPGISIRETVLHQPIYFGQKDLSNTGEGFEKDLIEKILGSELDQIRGKIQNASAEVINILNKQKSLDGQLEQKKEWEQKRQDAEFKLRFFKKYGIEDKLKRQLDYDKDERKIKKVISDLSSYIDSLQDVIDSHEDDVKNSVLYKSEENPHFFETLFEDYSVVVNDFDKVKCVVENGRATLNQINNRLKDFLNKKQALKEEFALTERQLAIDLKSAGHQTVNPEEFKKISLIYAKANNMLKLFGKNDDQRLILHDSLIAAINRLKELWNEEYTEIVSVIEKINSPDSPLQIIPECKANKGEMLKYMQRVFYGSRIREATLKTLVDAYSDFGDMYLDLDGVKSRIGNSFDCFYQYFIDNLDKLLVWQVPNRYVINYYGKPLAQHSLGQRASALMIFVLTQKENDVVVIDQPEDDLDNQTIYIDVIQLIRKLKPMTQFIFATHNANIPVLGDAEQVIACEYKEEQISIKEGSIDCPNIQESIVTIMEGGAEAFKKRKQVYESWKQQNS